MSLGNGFKNELNDSNESLSIQYIPEIVADQIILLDKNSKEITTILIKRLTYRLRCRKIQKK